MSFCRPVQLGILFIAMLVSGSITLAQEQGQQGHQVDQMHLNGWSAKTESLSNGVLLTVTSSDPQQVQHIRGLGFIGFMASGSHHQAHHLAMAKGEFVHSQ
jgi:hypothetical protein